MSWSRCAAFLFCGSLSILPSAPAQIRDDASATLRVTVSINPDGSRTAYRFDSANHKATATTTGKDGKVREKIRYVLDEAGRFSSGLVFGPNDQLRFKTLYKYDATGRLLQETQLGDDDAVQHKIVYTYDTAGKQTGYSVYDASGKIIGQTKAPALPERSTAAKPKSR